MVHQGRQQIGQQVDAAHGFGHGHQHIHTADQNQHAPRYQLEGCLFVHGAQQHQNQREGEADQADIILEADDEHHHGDQCDYTDDLVPGEGRQFFLDLAAAVQLIAAEHDVQHHRTEEVCCRDTQKDWRCNVIQSFNTGCQIGNEDSGQGNGRGRTANGTQNCHTTQQNGRSIHLGRQCDSEDDHDRLDRDRTRTGC